VLLSVDNLDDRRLNRNITESERLEQMMDQRKPKPLYWWLLAWLGLITVACSTVEPETVERQYDLAIQHMDKEEYAQAIPLFQKIIEQNPGTRFAAYAYLKTADAQLYGDLIKDFDDAETNYRIFLEYSSFSHLVPYVLSRLIELNYKRNTSFLFGESYTYSRDPEHFKKIITEYQRFFFLYPESLYLKEARHFLDKSIEALAEHELLIADWYFKHALYPAAISRYRYILNHYPNFAKTDRVVEKLIKTYQYNQQPETAAELERVVILRQGS
jgi:outer membrane protein assembly factor BamD